MAERDLHVGINRVENPDDMSDLEKKHVPVITAPDSVKAGECFEVKIEVGKYKDHPNDKDHFIQLVELYAGDVYLTRLSLVAERSCPVVTTCVSLHKQVGPLRAYEVCNIHGIWEGTKEIEVT